jgi:hypothetical protein
MSDGALELLQKMASEMKKSKRRAFPMSLKLTEHAEIVWQVTSRHKRFEIGSLRLTHGKIRTRSTNCDTPEPQHGLSMAKPS